VANRAGATVTRIDTRSFSTSTIPVGLGPTGIAVGAGAVWVANGDEGTVSRIDPETEEVVDRIEVGNRPEAIVVAGGFVWVTVLGA
jgi:YVTN family beta-propeller protein